MSERTCTLVGCGERHKGHGYCRLHYQRWKGTGEPGPLRESPICSVDGCDEPRSAKGHCRNHYQKLRKYGDPLLTCHSPEVVRRRFDSNVGPANPDGCAEWRGHRDPAGYGVFCVGKKSYRAHRWLYEQVVGPVPRHLVMRHTCDNPPCVSIGHLLTGSNADNSADCVARNRQARGLSHGAHLKPHRRPRGESNGLTHLSDGQVRDIRSRCAAGAYQKHVAREFGITQGTVSKIVRRATWAHVA